MYYKIFRLLLTPTSSKPSTTTEVFIANPQIDQESILGKLFFIGEIESTKPQALKIINFFTSYLEQAYYRSEKISLREKMGTINIEELFENSLAKVNTEFENFLKKEKIKISPKLLNIACGVVFKNILVFSSTGSIKALLIHPEQATKDALDDKKIYKITTIDDRENAEKRISLNKVFSNVTEGKIPPDGYVVFTNEILPEYITNKHLTKIITTLPPTSAIEQIKNQLHKINSYVSFLALIIKNSSTPHVQRSIPKMNVNVTAQNSLEQMNETENETEKYLSSVGMIKAGRLVNIFKSLFAKINFSQNSKVKTTIRDKMFFAKKERLRFLGKIKEYAKNLLNIIAAVVAYIARAAANPKKTILKTADYSVNSYRRLKKWTGTSIQWFFGLSSLNKGLLIIFLIFTTLFSYNIYRLTYEKNKIVLEQKYQETTQLIIQKQNQINSSLLYKNEQGARELLDQTQILIAELESYEGADPKIIANFKNENDAQIEKISHVVKIESPTEIAQLKKLNNSANPQVMAVLEKNLFVAAKQQAEVYEVNLANSSAGIAAKNAELNFAAPLSGKEAVFISANGGLIVYDNEEPKEINASFASSDQAITDIRSYNGRIYLLSATENNLFRFDKNYSNKSSWLKEDLDFSNAVSFDVDGYIYVLKNNGTVTKLLSGYSNEFELKPISPSFVNPTKIRITGESDEGLIYIMEPEKNRIVVFDKTGAFIIQYKMEKLTNMKDFSVVDDGKKIIILNDASVYEIETQSVE